MAWSYLLLVAWFESKTFEMGDVGERSLSAVGCSMVKVEIQRKSELVLSLEMGSSIECIYYIRD
ncbi:MAG: hypothetical protein WBB31_14570 [Saprospiraceae bacterium]